MPTLQQCARRHRSDPDPAGLLQPEQAAERRELGYVPCFADLEPDLSSDQAPTSHQTALSLRRLAEDADLSAALGLRLEENTADYIGQLVIELGSNCLWESTNEVSAAA